MPARSPTLTNRSARHIPAPGILPEYVEVLGLALATNTVTVNGQGTYRKGEYFRRELTVNNSSVPVWQSVSVAAAGETTVAGNVFVSKTPETFGYDADGNLTNDGRWTFTWDAENRLTKAESLATNPTDSKRRVVWEFDGQGRRIRQTTVADCAALGADDDRVKGLQAGGDDIMFIHQLDLFAGLEVAIGCRYWCFPPLSVRFQQIDIRCD